MCCVQTTDNYSITFCSLRPDLRPSQWLIPVRLAMSLGKANAYAIAPSRWSCFHQRLLMVALYLCYSAYGSVDQSSIWLPIVISAHMPINRESAPRCNIKRRTQLPIKLSTEGLWLSPQSAGHLTRDFFKNDRCFPFFMVRKIFLAQSILFPDHHITWTQHLLYRVPSLSQMHSSRHSCLRRVANSPFRHRGCLFRTTGLIDRLGQ